MPGWSHISWRLKYFVDVPLTCLYDNQNPISGVDCIWPLSVKYFNRTGFAVRLYWNRGCELSTDLEQIRSTIRVASVISIVPLQPGLRNKELLSVGMKLCVIETQGFPILIGEEKLIPHKKREEKSCSILQTQSVFKSSKSCKCYCFALCIVAVLTCYFQERAIKILQQTLICNENKETEL